MLVIGVYLRGNSITLVQEFGAPELLTGGSAPVDPATVVFEVRSPDDAVVSYVFGTDANVTNPQVGLYLCALDPQLPPGDYAFAAISTDPDQQHEDTFAVLPSGVLPPVHATVADYGPCSGWIDGAYVARFDPSLGVGSSDYLLDPVAEMGSQLMYELSARQFPGVCERTVRPCRQTCGCFGSPSLGLGPWYWPSGWMGGIGGAAWRNECGDTCGCGSESYIRLAGYPVRAILEVKIDGAVVDPSEYRLDGRRNLIRLADLTNPAVPVDRAWPACQDLSLPDTEPGTYSVTYEWGAIPPELGKQAAAQLAVELWKASPANQGECRLPAKVTRIVRGGVTLERVVPMADLLRQGATGLALVDAFVGMTNPQKAHRRSAVYSPDVQPFGRQVGQG